jgi:hypothetical protein
MDINFTPTHPKANSYVSVDYADDYLFRYPEFTAWENLSVADKEKYLMMATRKIDTLTYVGRRHFERAMHYRNKQALQFPRLGMVHYAGTPNNATATSIQDNALRDEPNYPDDYFNDGAIVFYDGKGRGQTLLVTDFDSATGTVTFEEASVVPDNTTQFMLFEEVYFEIKEATCEQALHEVLNPTASGLPAGTSRVRIDDVEVYAGRNGGAREVKLNISPKVMAVLSKYIDNTMSFR